MIITEILDEALELHRNGRGADAEALYRRVIQADNQNFDAWHMLGVVLAQRNALAEAETYIQKAMSLDDEIASCHHNYGNILSGLDRLEAAVDSYTRALTLAPDDALIHCDLGSAQKSLGRFDEASACFESALALAPDFPEAHLNRAILHLLRGDFERGWAGYEARWQTGQMPLLAQRFRHPRWRGDEQIEGKTIVLHAEQGLGDTIQFSRYAALLAERGARVVLEAQPPLARLLAQVAGVERVVGAGEAQRADFHCPLLSLPLAFGTRLDTIPAGLPYLQAAPDLVDAWTRKLGPGNRPRVGIAWAGSRTNQNGAKRSIALARLLPLRELGVQLVSLQKELSEDEQAIFASQGDMVHFGGDFPDTAALVSLMDLVISVDTSIAHLAGAMGAPLWLLLERVPDWRWLLERQDSPWYPTAKLFRQQQAGDWDGVLQQVSDALAQGLRDHA